MRIGTVDVAGQRQGPGTAPAETIGIVIARAALAAGFLVTHLCEQRCIAPDISQVVPDDVADNCRDETAWSDVTIGLDGQGELAADAPFHERTLAGEPQ